MKFLTFLKPVVRSHKNRAIFAGTLLTLLGGALLYLLLEAGVAPGQDQTAGKSGELSRVGEFEQSDLAFKEHSALSGVDLMRIRNLHKKLPGNIFLPPIPGDEADMTRLARRDYTLNRMRSLYFKLQKKEASGLEKNEYYSFRIKYNRDKIAMLRFMSSANKKATAEERQIVDNMITGLNGEIQKFETSRLN